MTTIIASAICTAIGFIAGALWQRTVLSKTISLLVRSVASENERADSLQAQNALLRHYLDPTGKLLPPEERAS